MLNYAVFDGSSFGIGRLIRRAGGHSIDVVESRRVDHICDVGLPRR